MTNPDQAPAVSGEVPEHLISVLAGEIGGYAIRSTNGDHSYSGTAEEAARGCPFAQSLTPPEFLDFVAQNLDS